jgi:hypothetical protein
VGRGGGAALGAAGAEGARPAGGARGQHVAGLDGPAVACPCGPGCWRMARRWSARPATAGSRQPPPAGRRRPWPGPGPAGAPAGSSARAARSAPTASSPPRGSWRGPPAAHQRGRTCSGGIAPELGDLPAGGAPWQAGLVGRGQVGRWAARRLLQMTAAGARLRRRLGERSGRAGCRASPASTCKTAASRQGSACQQRV